MTDSGLVIDGHDGGARIVLAGDLRLAAVDDLVVFLRAFFNKFQIKFLAANGIDGFINDWIIGFREEFFCKTIGDGDDSLILLYLDDAGILEPGIEGAFIIDLLFQQFAELCVD